MARAAHSSSGLTFSAAFGVRDANEASWTQVLEGVEFMADAVGIPDADCRGGEGLIWRLSEPR